VRCDTVLCGRKLLSIEKKQNIFVCNEEGAASRFVRGTVRAQLTISASVPTKLLHSCCDIKGYRSDVDEDSGLKFSSNFFKM